MGRVEFRRTCSQCRCELLPSLIERVYGWCVGEYRLGVAEHGKPCFVESPSPAFFNISHSGGIWLCAFSDAEDGDIGIDIERVERARMSVAEYAFSASEREALQNKPLLFSHFWTAKEAYAKLLGSGISRELLSTHELRTNYIVDVATGERRAQITLCTIAEGYICSLCTIAPPHSIEITPL